MDDRDKAIRDDLLLRLQPLPVTARGMFGGVGLYLEGKYFGLISDGILYFRTDSTSRDAYIERGMPAFQPMDRPRAGCNAGVGDHRRSAQRDRHGQHPARAETPRTDR